MRKLSLSLVVLLFSSSLHAQIPMTTEEEIEARLEQCLSESMGTYGPIECVEKAQAEWDAELNRVYKELMSLLDDEGKIQLREAQRAWIKYRDLDYKTMHHIGMKVRSTMFDQIEAGMKLDLTMNRALALNNYASELR